jgi:Pentapeptide repeats (8 copies)
MNFLFKEYIKKLQSKLSWKLLWLLPPIFILIVVVFPSYTGFYQSTDKEFLKVTENVIEKTTPSQKEVTKVTITDRLNPAKSLWDWMSLVLAPVTLAGLGFYFQSSQDKAKYVREQDDIKQAEAKELIDKALVADQQREAALQSYLDNISKLLVDKQLRQLLYQSSEIQNETPANDVVSSTTDATNRAINDFITKVDTAKAEPSIDVKAALDVIKAKTLSLLRLFDGDMSRKSSVLSFLGDTEVLQELKLDLSGSNWKDAFLCRANLSKAHLSKANLTGADLTGANLTGTYLNGANLTGTHLNEAHLNEAHLHGTFLNGADLSGAFLNGADLIGADLIGAKMIQAELTGAYLRGADLTGANLNGANLNGADLTGAKLNEADLTGAKLIKTKLDGADLTGAKGLAIK